MKFKSTRIQRLAPAFAFAAALLAPAASAQAASVLYSKYGSDYSYNSSSLRSVFACDKTYDVDAEYRQTYANGTHDNTARNSGQTRGDDSCVGVTTPTSTKVWAHRIVQLVPFQPDNYGSWKYPG